MNRGGRAVELPAAVIGDDNRIRASINRTPRILPIHNALQHKLSAPQPADPSDVVPGDGWIELLFDPRKQRSYVIHAVNVPGEVAEGPARCPQHIKAPFGLLGHVDKSGDSGFWRNRKPVA